mmetsp:Transcript_5276/g.13335  ORF Transcript_5276/g.13335 Transcript_5276/m.13335 type:complete len:288 (-) Transcript_5276:4750-5613(-)
MNDERHAGPRRIIFLTARRFSNRRARCGLALPDAPLDVLALAPRRRKSSRALPFFVLLVLWFVFARPGPPLTIIICGCGSQHVIPGGVIVIAAGAAVLSGQHSSRDAVPRRRGAVGHGRVVHPGLSWSWYNRLLGLPPLSDFEPHELRVRVVRVHRIHQDRVPSVGTGLVVQVPQHRARRLRPRRLVALQLVKHARVSAAVPRDADLPHPLAPRNEPLSGRVFLRGDEVRVLLFQVRRDSSLVDVEVPTLGTHRDTMQRVCLCTASSGSSRSRGARCRPPGTVSPLL